MILCPWFQFEEFLVSSDHPDLLPPIADLDATTLVIITPLGRGVAVVLREPCVEAAAVRLYQGLEPFGRADLAVCRDTLSVHRSTSFRVVDVGPLRTHPRRLSLCLPWLGVLGPANASGGGS